MPHINTGPGEYDDTSSAYIVRTDLEEPKILLHMHKILGVYMQFGGHKKLTQDPWEALTDEVLEESGYDMAQLLLLQPRDRIGQLGEGKTHPHSIYMQSHDFDGDPTHRHTDVAWAFVADQPPKYPVGAGESDQIRLFTRNELADLPNGQTKESVRRAALYVLDICLSQWERVDPAEFG